ncbi:MAG: DEAD/DEAH box helicase, partial [Proteobacteria bacterium]|nr:DEAD/DEAH box helicase [Pseudomonadota bacterium]
MKLEDLRPEMRVRGVEPSAEVKLLHVEVLGSDAVNVTYKQRSGGVGQQTLFRHHEAVLREVTASLEFAFSADAHDFKLAVEALRIDLAHLFDPMMAVHTADVEPLPHQIAAVYEEMLPRQPLRFLLADDPGAGKTIMAGLFIRELMLRGDLHRCLVVSPGGLVEQWQTEMNEKFGLSFSILSHQLVDETQTGNAFLEKDLLIARLDQLARNETWLDRLEAEGAGWDLIVVDEAHKMSASFFGRELKTTKRYQLGEILGRVTRHMLLMTATPHNGKEEDFRLFMSLLDSERFLGRVKNTDEKVDATDLMRRMIKEDLLKFDGKKLFPERRAETIPYELSTQEQALYDEVTAYVRTEMGRADALDNRRRGTVGFALTILQRRLASSPLAIYKSLQRRRTRLEEELEELRAGRDPVDRDILELFDDASPETIDDTLDELGDAEMQTLQDRAVANVTAARKPEDLRTEIAILRGLEASAKAMVASRQDRKWDELSKLLQADAMRHADGRWRKLIVFTEHKDTLDYLNQRVAGVIGNPEAVVTIHGGTRREDRLEVQERFRQSPEVVVLVATDAACEGVNLQNANLLINYDLPWNPNRIEQRFGRIHRIGQDQVCTMWNLVAMSTREGQVYHRLFEKLEVERAALGGRVFDVLGKAFEGHSLREMLIRAIRYSEDPETRRRLTEEVDSLFEPGRYRSLIEDEALSASVMTSDRLFRVREEMERAEARKLQPYYLRGFFKVAFERLDGELRERESHRYFVPHVPASIRQTHAVHGDRRPVLKSYERITFDRELRRVLHKPPAELMHPGHPLMSAVIRLTKEQLGPAMREGATLVDVRDESKTPRVLCLVEHGVREGPDPSRLASQRIHMVELCSGGEIRHAGYAAHLDYDRLPEEARALADGVRRQPWLKGDIEHRALSYATQKLVPEHLQEVATRREQESRKALHAVHERLTKEIHRLSNRAVEL